MFVATVRDMKEMNKSSASKDFSRTQRAALTKRGIDITTSTWLPAAAGGDFTRGERGYMLDDNGTGRIRTYAQVVAIAAGGSMEAVS